MKISDIFKQQPNVDRSKNDTSQQAVKEQETKQEQQIASGADTVQISSRARSFAAITKVLGEDEAARAARVEELKGLVQNGEYEVDSNSVAESILAFANDR